MKPDKKTSFRRWAFVLAAVLVMGAQVAVSAGPIEDDSTAEEPGDVTSKGKGKGKGSGLGKGKGKARGSSESNEVAVPESEKPETSATPSMDGENGIMTTITAITDNEVTFLRGTSGSSGKGKGGKGRSSEQGGDQSTLPVAENFSLTEGSIARRTQQFQRGRELGGGLRHAVFAALSRSDGVKARIVIDEREKSITEINVIVPEATMEDAIAVRPKRPPLKAASQKEQP